MPRRAGRGRVFVQMKEGGKVWSLGGEEETHYKFPQNFQWLLPYFVSSIPGTKIPRRDQIKYETQKKCFQGKFISIIDD